MLSEKKLDGRRCYFAWNDRAEDVLIQAVDGHDLDMLTQEIAHIQRLTAVPFSLAAFLVEDWNGALSPWPAPPAFGDAAFDGKAQDTLDFVTDVLLLYLQSGFAPGRVHLGGYSLSGLFALWAACCTDDFCGVAAASPSVWFPGWMDFAAEHRPQARHVYLSLGDREEKTRNRAMACVGENIRGTHALLRGKTDCTLEWNLGNHFADADLRTARGFAWVLDRCAGKGEGDGR